MQNNINLQDIPKKALSTKPELSQKNILYENQHQIYQNVHFVQTKQTEQIKQDPLNAIQQLPQTARIFFDRFIYYDCHFRVIYPTQRKIGSWNNVTSRQARRVLQQLEEQGFIRSEYRHKTSKIYTVNPFFRNIGVRKLLAHVLRSCRFAPLLFQIAQAQINQNTPIFSSQSENVRQEKNIVLFNYYNLLTNRKLTNVDRLTFSREQTNGHDPGGYQQKNILAEKKVREVESTNPIRTDIRALGELRLTRWGQIKLMAFDQRVISYAYQQFKKTNKRNMHDPFAWFVAVCISYSKKNNIKPNWSIVSYLNQTYNKPVDARMSLPLQPQPTPKPINPTEIVDESTEIDFITDKFVPAKKYDEFRTDFDVTTQEQQFNKTLADDKIRAQYNKNLAILGLPINLNPFENNDTLKQTVKLVTNAQNRSEDIL